MAQKKQNQDFAALEATGMPIRIAMQKNGKARVYLGAGRVFEEFYRNRDSSGQLIEKAPIVAEQTHLGRALRYLAARITEAHDAHAKAVAKMEQTAFRVVLAPAGAGMSFGQGRL